MHTVVILAIGNELLIGETLDTNTNWLCRYFTNLGLQVIGSLMIADDKNTISKAISTILKEGFIGTKVDLLVTTGGLGPTEDDLTLAALAQAVNLPLQLDQTSYEWIKTKYQEYASQNYVTTPEMNVGREKMAILPLGSTPIANSVGVAPAVKLDYNNITIICLPGVPKETKAFVSGPVQQILAELFELGTFLEANLWAECGDESILAPILSDVSKRHPKVYIKSKAKGFGVNLEFHIMLHVRGNASEIETLLEEAKIDLEDKLKQSKINLTQNPQT